MNKIQIRNDGHPDYSDFGSYDGFQNEFPVEKCTTCNGKGSTDYLEMNVMCSDCKGEGYICLN